MFDTSTYTGGTFNTAEFLQSLQDMQIYLMTQFEDCKTTNFLFSLDNRLSDFSFLSGSMSQVGTQIATAATYYSLSTYMEAGSPIQTAMTSLWEKSSIYLLYNNTLDYIKASQWENLGKLYTKFLLSIVNYKAPNVNTGRGV